MPLLFAQMSAAPKGKLGAGKARVPNASRYVTILRLVLMWCVTDRVLQQRVGWSSFTPLRIGEKY